MRVDGPASRRSVSKADFGHFPRWEKPCAPYRQGDGAWITGLGGKSPALDLSMSSVHAPSAQFGLKWRKGSRETVFLTALRMLHPSPPSPVKSGPGRGSRTGTGGGRPWTCPGGCPLGSAEAEESWTDPVQPQPCGAQEGRAALRDSLQAPGSPRCRPGRGTVPCGQCGGLEWAGLSPTTSAKTHPPNFFRLPLLTGKEGTIGS